MKRGVVRAASTTRSAKPSGAATLKRPDSLLLPPRFYYECRAIFARPILADILSYFSLVSAARNDNTFACGELLEVPYTRLRVAGTAHRLIDSGASLSPRTFPIDEKMVIVTAAVIMHSAYMLFAVSANFVFEASRAYGRQLILSCETLISKVPPRVESAEWSCCLRPETTLEINFVEHIERLSLSSLPAVVGIRF